MTAPRNPAASSSRQWLLGAVVLWAATLQAAAQAPRQRPNEGLEGLVVRAYTLEHQPVVEAVALIHSLLSERGAVEIQPGGNTLVIRDSPAVVERLVRLLDDFDHPARPVRLAVQLVRAGLGTASDSAGDELPEALVRRLKELLRYDDYRLLAAAEMQIREGEQVAYELGDEFQVGFRMGTLLAGGRVKLHGFRVARQAGNPGARQLIHTHLNLWLDKPMILGLARAESSDRALMVVLTCSLDNRATP